MEETPSGLAPDIYLAPQVFNLAIVAGIVAVESNVELIQGISEVVAAHEPDKRLPQDLGNVAFVLLLRKFKGNVLTRNDRLFRPAKGSTLYTPADALAKPEPSSVDAISKTGLITRGKHIVRIPVSELHPDLSPQLAAGLLTTGEERVLPLEILLAFRDSVDSVKAKRPDVVYDAADRFPGALTLRQGNA
jgi:hypothetical protein